MKGRATLIGLALTVAVHGSVGAFLATYEKPHREAKPVPTAKAEPRGSVRFGICEDGRRCTMPERRLRRRPLASDPLTEPQILEAELLPALGMVEQDPKTLPELQAYEEEEVIEDGVNLREENKPPEEPPDKEFKPRPQRRKSRNKLSALLKGYRNKDKRRRPTQLEKIVGKSDGVVGGTGSQAKEGNAYLRQVSRVLRRDFQPGGIPDDVLEGLKAVVKITMLIDGTIDGFRLVSPSGSRAFDEAALRTIRLYSSETRDNKTLPAPDPELLRFINTKGLRIRFDGKYRSK